MKKSALLITCLLNGISLYIQATDKHTQMTLHPEKALALPHNQKKEIEVRVVNTMQFMGESESGKQCRTEFEATRQEAALSLQDEINKIKQAETEYVSKASAMSDAARKKAETNIQNMQRDYERLAMEKEEALRLQAEEMTKVVIDDMRAAVIDIAQKENVDLVFDTQGGIIFAADNLDFTALVTQKSNDMHQEQLVKNKQTESTTVAHNSSTKKSSDVPAKS